MLAVWSRWVPGASLQPEVQSMRSQVWWTTVWLLAPLVWVAVAYGLNRIRPRDSGIVALGGPVVALSAALAGLLFIQSNSEIEQFVDQTMRAAWWLTAGGLLAALAATPSLMTESFRRHRASVIVGALLGVGIAGAAGGWSGQ